MAYKGKKLRKIRLHDVRGERSEATYDPSLKFFIGGCPRMPFRCLRLSAQTLRHTQKNNPRNINYMPVVIFSNIPRF